MLFLHDSLQLPGWGSRGGAASLSSEQQLETRKWNEAASGSDWTLGKDSSLGWWVVTRMGSFAKVVMARSLLEFKEHADNALSHMD